MNLIIDIGNTLAKVALFDNDEPVELFISKELSLQSFKQIRELHPDVKTAIISSVSVCGKRVDSYLKTHFQLMEFNSQTKIPVINKYKTPETLGLDRLAAACGAYGIFPNENVLVIDAGTCIKYDIVNSKREYLGGAISPGVTMQLKAMHAFTEKLPLITPKDFDYQIGDTTEKSMLSGVMNGTLREIEGAISTYENEFKNLKVILSGGDMNYFAGRLKSSIFAVPNIVLKGLNEILKFNVSKKN